MLALTYVILVQGRLKPLMHSSWQLSFETSVLLDFCVPKIVHQVVIQPC